MTRRRLVWACCAIALLIACGDDTTLAIHLALPTRAELNPLKACAPQGGCDAVEPRLARFSLRISPRGGAAIEQSVRVDTRDLTLGRVPLDQSFDLRLSAETAAGQILGLGTARDVSVEDGETVVSLVFRKPVGYLATPSGLDVFDTAATGAASASLPRLPLEGVDAVASAPNGAFVACATASRIVVLRTLDHDSSLELPLPRRAHKLRVSPSGRYLFVMQDNELSAVDLLADQPQLLGRGVGGTPSEIAFDPDGRHAWLLVDGLTDGASCTGAPTSKLVRLQYGLLRDPTGVSFAPLEGEGFVLDYAASDMLLHAPSQRLIIARPCAGDVISSSASGQSGPAQQQPLATVKDVLDLALAGESLVVVTKDPLPGSAAGQVLRLALDGGAEPLSTLFAIPPIAMPVGTGTTSVGRFSWISEPSDELIIRQVEVAPDGQRALLLYQTRFVSNLVPAPGCTLALDARGAGYMVLDLTTGTPLLNRLTQLDFQTCVGSCISVAGRSLADPSVCEAAFVSALRGQRALSNERFSPSSATLLFGGY